VDANRAVVCRKGLFSCYDGEQTVDCFMQPKACIGKSAATAYSEVARYGRWWWALLVRRGAM